MTGAGWHWGAVTGFPTGRADGRRAVEVVRRLGAAGADLVLLEPGPAGTDSHDTGALAAFTSALGSTTGVVPGGVVDAVPPYLLARRTVSLDHLSGGAGGWWCTGTTGFAPGRVAEHLQVLDALWGSWGPDAVVQDRDRGVYADHTAVHAIDHRGPHYAVRGPLNTLPSPQGRPVLVLSHDGAESEQLAARHGDVLLLDARPSSTDGDGPADHDTRADAVARLRAGLDRAGRGPGDCLALVRVDVTDPVVVAATVRACGADGFLVDVPAGAADHEVDHRLTATTADLVRVLTGEGLLAPPQTVRGLRRRLQGRD